MSNYPTPTTGAGAAQLLVDLAAAGEPERMEVTTTLGDQVTADLPRVLTPNVPPRPGDSLWQSLTRRANSHYLAPRHAAMLAKSQALPHLPAVLTGGPWQQRSTGHLGYLTPGSSSLVPSPTHSALRARLSVLGDLSGIPATPEGAWALTVTILGAQQAAEDLSAWAPTLAASDARAARDEARAYTAHATAAEDLLAPAFGWLADLPQPRAAEDTPTVPALMRAQMGTT